MWILRSPITEFYNLIVDLWSIYIAVQFLKWMNSYHLFKLCHIGRAFLTRFHFEIKINNSITFFKLAWSMFSLELLTVIITFHLYLDKFNSLYFSN